MRHISKKLSAIQDDGIYPYDTDSDRYSDHSNLQITSNVEEANSIPMVQLSQSSPRQRPSEDGQSAFSSAGDLLPDEIEDSFQAAGALGQISAEAIRHLAMTVAGRRGIHSEEVLLDMQKMLLDLISEPVNRGKKTGGKMRMEPRSEPSISPFVPRKVSHLELSKDQVATQSLMSFSWTGKESANRHRQFSFEAGDDNKTLTTDLDSLQKKKPVEVSPKTKNIRLARIQTNLSTSPRIRQGEPQPKRESSITIEQNRRPSLIPSPTTEHAMAHPRREGSYSSQAAITPASRKSSSASSRKSSLSAATLRRAPTSIASRPTPTRDGLRRNSRRMPNEKMVATRGTRSDSPFPAPMGGAPSMISSAA